MTKSGHEWGFKLSTITSNDKQLDWKFRLKALEVMVPSEKENSARALISDTFKQRPSRNTFKTATECYIYVGNEREHKDESMATIFLEMVGRHKFQLSYLEFIPVTSIVKNIDIKLATRDPKVLMTLRQMILNLPSRNKKYGEQLLFQSVDFVPDPNKIWFKKEKGTGAACFYLSYYKWAEGEAQHVADGLGAYLGNYYGHESIFSSFAADHWLYVQEWKWNRSKQKFDTPQEMNLAENVLYDPTASIMKAVQEETEVTEQEEVTNAGNTEVPNESTNVNTNDEVNELQNRDENVQQNNDYVYDEHTASVAVGIARSIQSASSMSDNSISDDVSTSLSQLAIQRANHIARAQLDSDLNSVPETNVPDSRVSQVIQGDDISTTSSMTDITNNTNNRAYYTQVNDDQSVASYDTSFTLKSLCDADLDKVITTEMSTEQLENAITEAMKKYQKQITRKGNMFLTKVLKEKRLVKSQAAGSCEAEETK